MAIIEVAKIQVRRGQELQTGIPRLDPGELGWAEDTENLYIGKRIAEGAVDDNNTRILTNNDLDNIFSLIANTTTNNTYYRYRDQASWIHSQGTTVQTKLDSSVSLIDYGVVPLIDKPIVRTVSNASTTGTYTIYLSTTTGIIPQLGYTVSGANIVANTTITSVSKDFSIGIGTSSTGVIAASSEITINPPDGTQSVDITNQFQDAVNDLFNNADAPADARRALGIPAGNFSISRVIPLPPYTTLKGQGQDITILTLTSTNTNMFETMDALGNSITKIQYKTDPFADITNMASGRYRSKDVTIQDMTLQFAASVVAVNTNSLISLDNVLNANIKSVSFNTEYDRAAATTYGLVSGSSKGISIHGSGGSINGSAATNLCVDVCIDDCKFDSLVTGVFATGNVIRPRITNSNLGNLNQGIVMQYDKDHNAPSNGLFRSNRFEDVISEGIYVSTGTNIASHISENNYFINVGNGVDDNNEVILDDTITTSSGATSVITFLSSGNTSINDYFNRRTVANNPMITDFYYNPLVTGRVAINNNTSMTMETSGVNTASIMKIGLNGQDQMLSVRYQMVNGGLSRKGNMIVNVAKDGYASITDTYNYIIETGTVSNDTINMAAITSLSSTNNLVVDASHTTLNSIVGNFSGYLITGSEAYKDLAAVVLSVSKDDTNYVLITDSASPAFDYTTVGETYTLVQSGNDQSYFGTDETHAQDKNYVMLTLENNLINTKLEYQIDILT